MNDKKSFTTIKLYADTAAKLKKHCKKHGYTIAGWCAIVVINAINQDKK